MDKNEKDIHRVTRGWKDAARKLRLKPDLSDDQQAVAATLEACAHEIEHALEKARQKELTRARRQDSGTYRGRKIPGYLDDDYDED